MIRQLFIIAIFSFNAGLPAQAAPLMTFDSIMRMTMQRRVSELKKQSHAAARYLRDTAFSENESLENRWRAVVTMGRMDPVHFRESLNQALQSRDWFMRNAALIALQTDERQRAVSWSARLLADKALVVRTQAVRNLVLLEAKETEPLLWKAIASPVNFSGEQSLWIRESIAEALARFAVKGRNKAFEGLLLDRDERLHKWAIAGLEASTGLKMSGDDEPVEIRRQKWLSRLGVQEI